MTHRRRARPWRVTADSLAADPHFTSRNPRTADLGAASSHGCGILSSLAGDRRLLPPRGGVLAGETAQV